MKPLRLRTYMILLLTFTSFMINAQGIKTFADSIRRAYKIPELAYAVVSADSVFDIQVMGVRKKNSPLNATVTDRFRIGSNTKAVTGFIAAQLVKQGKISWNTRFFDLFPELEKTSRAEYRQLTLLNLLTFRTRLYKYTYTYPEPVKGQFTGDEARQRYQFAQWFFKHTPVPATDSVNFSNLGYVAAGLMLEKASGKSYKALVAELGDQLGLQFGFGRPNASDTLQTWGHNARLQPEARTEDYKLEWLQAAGNINCTLPDYLKFIQLQLKGLQGRYNLLSKQEFQFLLYGRPVFAVGWFPGKDTDYGQYAWNEGNPGSFLTKVYMYTDLGKAFILFANAQTDEADEGLDVLLTELKRRYAHQ